jgi:hypothetical protein
MNDRMKKITATSFKTATAGIDYLHTVASVGKIAGQ